MHSILCNMFSANMCVLIILIGINLLASNVSCIRCYVCDASNCSNFNVLNKTSFEKQCPSEYLGCVTHKNGHTIISRVCESVNVHGCYSLGDRDYCFCSTNLCNGLNYNFESDDEELDEGSGTEAPSPDDMTTKTIQRKSSGANVLKSVILPVCSLLWLI